MLGCTPTHIVCHSFKESGWCRKGDRCRRWHDPPDMSPIRNDAGPRGGMISDGGAAGGGMITAGAGIDMWPAPQDMRNMGGLAAKLPVTSAAMMIGSMSIIGIPLIGGFWSKEAIVAK